MIFFSALDCAIPQILILDVMLPKINGFEILKRLKNSAKFSKIAVMILSAKEMEMDKVKGLELGADDYMTKPFSVMEFIARVKNIQKRISTKAPEILGFDGLELFVDEHCVRLNGKEINLALKEFELLKFMLENCKTALERDTLLNMLWGYSTHTRTLDMHINTLRQKLGKWAKHIQTSRFGL